MIALPASMGQRTHIVAAVYEEKAKPITTSNPSSVKDRKYP